VLRSWTAPLLDLLLPPACFRCGRDLPADASVCGACALAIPEAAPVLVPGAAACLAGAAYAGEVEGWVRAFKYPGAAARFDPAPEALLGWLLARAADRVPPPLPALVVPVPLHPRRLRARGFNPAGLLARRLARGLGVAFDPVALVRVRDTASQTGLDARARQRNVAGAFRFARRGRAPARVWLVDDVVTTGSTLSASARALGRAGAREVIGVCAAATP
jgi:ComF family protein